MLVEIIWHVPFLCFFNPEFSDAHFSNIEDVLSHSLRLWTFHSSRLFQLVVKKITSITVCSVRFLTVGTMSFLPPTGNGLYLFLVIWMVGIVLPTLFHSYSTITIMIIMIVGIILLLIFH